MPKEEFQQEVEKEPTGRETEPWESICFKPYRSHRASRVLVKSTLRPMA